MEAEITIFYESEREAEAIVKAVSPDNVKVPTGLNVKTERRGNVVWTFVKCDRGFRTFIGTIDDLLFAISTAEKTLKTARKLE
ncbi:MAG: KEOPS complex subunit Pcc1 [Candidatus Bathyarchaeia archaeon]